MNCVICGSYYEKIGAFKIFDDLCGECDYDLHYKQYKIKNFIVELNQKIVELESEIKVFTEGKP